MTVCDFEEPCKVQINTVPKRLACQTVSKDCLKGRLHICSSVQACLGYSADFRDYSVLLTPWCTTPSPPFHRQTGKAFSPIWQLFLTTKSLGDGSTGCTIRCSYLAKDKALPVLLSKSASMCVCTPFPKRTTGATSHTRRMGSLEMREVDSGAVAATTYPQMPFRMSTK